MYIYHLVLPILQLRLRLRKWLARSLRGPSDSNLNSHVLDLIQTLNCPVTEWELGTSALPPDSQSPELWAHRGSVSLPRPHPCWALRVHTGAERAGWGATTKGFDTEKKGNSRALSCPPLCLLSAQPPSAPPPQHMHSQWHRPSLLRNHWREWRLEVNRLRSSRALTGKTKSLTSILYVIRRTLTTLSLN